MGERTGRTSVIVIGGGIVGCSILYHLAKTGRCDALLLERNELTSGATWHAAGNVHTQSAFPNLSALQAYSLRLYDGLAEEVGQEVGSHVVGGFFLAQTPERMEEFRFLAGKFRALGIEYELVTPSEIKAKHPLIATDGLVGGAWDPEEGYVDPYSVTMGLAAGARRYGASILREKRVDRIERRSGGWRVHVGEEYWDCEILVNAGGFWANEVARMVGARLPITNMEHHYIVTESMAEVAAHPNELPMIRDTDSQFYMRQEADGLLLGPWEKDCRAAWGGKGAPWSFGMELFEDDLDRLSDELSAIHARVPALNAAGVKRIVNGAISFAPDARPMIGPLPGAPDFFVACGFLGGIAQAGGVGLAMSQWILDGEPEMDLSFIDVARFGDWTTQAFARERTYEVFPIRYEIIYPQLERQTGRRLRTTPIYSTQLAYGAVMGQAYGWERPLWYAPDHVAPRDEPSFERPNWFEHVGEECRAVAERVGLIDISAYSKFLVEGANAHAFLDYVGSAKAPTVDGRMRLSLLLNERGGVIGDVTVCRLSETSFYLVGATLAEGVYRRWLERHAAAFDVSISVATASRGVLGVTGPNARALLQSLSEDDFSTSAFPFMTCRPVEIGRVRGFALRVSYAGELGWELHCPMEHLYDLFDTLLAEGEPHGLQLVGSRALSNLRLEKGYRSWGHELTVEVSPRAAGLEAFCSRSKDYIGRAAVDAARETIPQRVLATLAVEPRGGDSREADCWGSEPIFQGETLVGYATSGGYGWRLGQSLCVGWINSDVAEPGGKLDVQILGDRRAATVVADPAFDPDNARLLS